MMMMMMMMMMLFVWLYRPRGAACADSTERRQRRDSRVQERASPVPDDRLHQRATRNQRLPADGPGRRRQQSRQIHTGIWSVPFFSVMPVTLSWLNGHGSGLCSSSQCRVGDILQHGEGGSLLN